MGNSGERGVCGLGDRDDDEEEIEKMFMSEGEDEDQGKDGHEHSEQPGQDRNVDPEQEEEGLIAKGIQSPEQPTRQEIEEHELTHVPFRQWCVHSQKGRGVPSPHCSKKVEGKLEEEHRAMTTMNMDYMYFTEKEQEGIFSWNEVTAKKKWQEIGQAHHGNHRQEVEESRDPSSHPEGSQRYVDDEANQ